MASHDQPMWQTETGTDPAQTRIAVSDATAGPIVGEVIRRGVVANVPAGGFATEPNLAAMPGNGPCAPSFSTSLVRRRPEREADGAFR
ncbi:MAG: hypothetical protein ACREDH_09110 [Methylocella sp.]